MAITTRPKVLILGAGFAGVGVFHSLRKELSKKDCDITLVDENNFSLYTPMLSEAAGGSVDAPDIVAPIRSLIRHKCTFDQGRVQTIDTANQKVTITIGGTRYGIPETTRELGYDHLVICLGSTENYHNIPGVEENSIGAKVVEDAIEIRNRALALLERADEEPDDDARKHLLSFVVAGGGFTGVETMAAVNDMVRELEETYSNIKQDDIRMILITPGDRLLPETGEKLAMYTARELQKRGVEIMFNTVVNGAGPNWIDVKAKSGGDVHRIEAHTFIWAGGVMPVPVIRTAGLTFGKHGGIAADSTCRVPDHANIWALGDCAEVPIPGQDGTYAPTAQNAIREGKRVGKNIAAVIRGKEPQPFVFTPIGELAVVGKHAGVAVLYGRHVKGFIAWWMWRVIYLAKLPRFSQRFRVGLDWFTDAFFGRDIAQLPSGRGPSSVDSAREPAKSGSEK